MNRYTPGIEWNSVSNTAIESSVTMQAHEQGDWFKAEEVEKVLREIQEQCRFTDEEAFDEIEHICQKHLGGEE